jgi:hypothetical protein
VYLVLTPFPDQILLLLYFGAFIELLITNISLCKTEFSVLRTEAVFPLKRWDPSSSHETTTSRIFECDGRSYRLNCLTLLTEAE